MLEQRTVLLQTFTTEGRHVGCDFIKIIYQDGQEIGRAREPHSISFPPDADLAFWLNELNRDITSRRSTKLGDGFPWPAITPEEWARVEAYCAVAHTPEVKAAYKKFVMAQAAEVAGITKD